MLLARCCCPFTLAPASPLACAEAERPLRAEPCALAWPLALAAPWVREVELALAFWLPLAAPEPDTSIVLSPAPRAAWDVDGNRRGCGFAVLPDG